MNRVSVLLAACLLAIPAAAQQRQPAQLSTTPGAVAPTLDLLDKSGSWLKLGQPDSANHVFSSYNSDSIDVRQFGCVADGVTDQAACINNAIDKAPGCVLIPATTQGFFVAAGSTVIAKKCLRGEFYSPGVSISTPANVATSPRPWLKCETSTTSVCVKVVDYHGAYIEGLTLVAQFPPAAGSIGLQTTNAYNAQYRDIHVSGFDRCAQWGPGSGISARVIGLNLTWCQSYYVVQDGWPELYITDGRWGSNGQGNLNPPPKAMVYITKTVTGGGGSGPNGLVLTGIQANPGGGSVECMVKWGGFIDATGDQRQFKFIGNHWEFLKPLNSPAQNATFCSDATVPKIAQLYAVDSEFQWDEVGPKVFALNAATSLQESYISNSYFSGDDTTVAFKGTGLGAAHASHWSHSFFGGALNLTGTAGTNLSWVDNVSGTSTITGTWSQLSVFNPLYSSWTDTAAHGNISFTSVRNFGWTPVVKFGGVTSTRTWSVAGLMTRTGTGGFTASFNANVSSGTETATGAMTISGLPYNCAAGFSTRPTFTQNNLAAGVGQVNFKPDSATPANIVVTKQGSTGYDTLKDTDITGTTQLAGEVECKWAN